MQEDRNDGLNIPFAFSKSGWIGYLGRNLDLHFSRGTFKISNIMAEFSYKVTFVGRNMALSFSEVSGLTAEYLITAPRSGNPPKPGFPNVTFRSGSVLCNNEVLDSIKAAKANAALPGTVQIQQLNEKGAVVQEWKLQDAQIAKFVHTGVPTVGKALTVNELGLVFKGVGSEARKGGGSHW